MARTIDVSSTHTAERWFCRSVPPNDQVETLQAGHSSRNPSFDPRSSRCKDLPAHLLHPLAAVLMRSLPVFCVGGDSVATNDCCEFRHASLLFWPQAPSCHHTRRP
jgi:hypothetical protein